MTEAGGGVERGTEKQRKWVRKQVWYVGEFGVCLDVAYCLFFLSRCIALPTEQLFAPFYRTHSLTVTSFCIFLSYIAITPMPSPSSSAPNVNASSSAQQSRSRTEMLTQLLTAVQCLTDKVDQIKEKVTSVQEDVAAIKGDVRSARPAGPANAQAGLPNIRDMTTEKVAKPERRLSGFIGPAAILNWSTAVDKAVKRIAADVLFARRGGRPPLHSPDKVWKCLKDEGHEEKAITRVRLQLMSPICCIAGINNHLTLTVCLTMSKSGLLSCI